MLLSAGTTCLTGALLVAGACPLCTSIMHVYYARLYACVIPSKLPLLQALLVSNYLVDYFLLSLSLLQLGYK